MKKSKKKSKKNSFNKKSSYKKMKKGGRPLQPTFIAVKPCCGPETYECVMKKIIFSDGIERYICTNMEVPESSWPKTVYQINHIEGGYDEIGHYNTTSTFSTQRYNPITSNWEGQPSVKTYHFTPN